jgi:virulence-associated protein VagC
MCDENHLCLTCYHAVRMPKLLSIGAVYNKLECFELDKDVTPSPIEESITECEHYKKR